MPRPTNKQRELKSLALELRRIISDRRATPNDKLKAYDRLERLNDKLYKRITAPDLKPAPAVPHDDGNDPFYLDDQDRPTSEVEVNSPEEAAAKRLEIETLRAAEKAEASRLVRETIEAKGGRQ